MLSVFNVFIVYAVGAILPWLILVHLAFLLSLSPLSVYWCQSIDINKYLLMMILHLIFPYHYPSLWRLYIGTLQFYCNWYVNYNLLDWDNQINNRIGYPCLVLNGSWQLFSEGIIRYVYVPIYVYLYMYNITVQALFANDPRNTPNEPRKLFNRSSIIGNFLILRECQLTNFYRTSLIKTSVWAFKGIAVLGKSAESWNKRMTLLLLPFPFPLNSGKLWS